MNARGIAVLVLFVSGLTACGVDAGEDPSVSPSSESALEAPAPGATTPPATGGTAPPATSVTSTTLSSSTRKGSGFGSCSAGPAGVGLPNRFVSCGCEQLVTSCSDASCATCSSPTYAKCDSTSWFAGINIFDLDCSVDEQTQCNKYCRDSAKCASGCT